MLKKYESGFILAPELEQDALTAEITMIENAIISAGGEIVKKEIWGKRNLAYPIKKKTEGSYCFFYYEATPDSQNKIAEALRMKQNILRSLSLTRKILPEKVKTEETTDAGTKS